MVKSFTWVVVKSFVGRGEVVYVGRGGVVSVGRGGSRLWVVVKSLVNHFFYNFMVLFSVDKICFVNNINN